VRKALQLTGNNKAKAAKLLGITPQGLNQFLKRKEHQ
jgi:DNA-binding transcriptional regulator YdaS (Cro superfamily)